MAAQNCVAMILSLRKILAFLGFDQLEPSRINEDNISCIAASKNSILNGRTKHMEMNQSFMRDEQEKKNVDLVWCPTLQQKADGLTKPLSGAMFKMFQGYLVIDLTDILGLKVSTCILRP